MFLALFQHSLFLALLGLLLVLVDLAQLLDMAGFRCRHQVHLARRMGVFPWIVFTQKNSKLKDSVLKMIHSAPNSTMLGIKSLKWSMH